MHALLDQSHIHAVVWKAAERSQSTAASFPGWYRYSHTEGPQPLRLWSHPSGLVLYTSRASTGLQGMLSDHRILSIYLGLCAVKSRQLGEEENA